MSDWLNFGVNFSKQVMSSLYQLVPSGTTKSAIPSTPVIEPPKMDLSILATKFNASPWIKVAAISGAIAVMMGAYGAHGLKLTPEKRAVFETANKYHFYHSLGLLGVPLLRRSKLVGTLFTLGILIFCGTCYCNSITGNTTVVRFTPIGGFMFIIGWLAMLF